MESALTRRALALGLALLAPCAVPAPAPAAKPSVKEAVLQQRLRERLEALAVGLDGVLGLSLKDLQSGATIELRADEVFPTASTIKLAVLYEVYRQAEEGKLDLSELVRPPTPRVGGGGVLQELGDQVQVTWRDLAVLMMGWSDNEATNRLVARVGQEAVNRRLAGLGFQQTRLKRLMMDLDAARRGDENVSTAAELRRLAELVRDAPGLSAARADDLRKVAAVPKSAPFREPLPEGLTVIDKPGDLEGVRAAAACVLLPGRPYSIGIMTGYLRRDADGERAIREISAAVFETFDRLARSSPHGRVISER